MPQPFFEPFSSHLLTNACVSIFHKWSYHLIDFCHEGHRFSKITLRINIHYEFITLSINALISGGERESIHYAIVGEQFC